VSDDSAIKELVHFWSVGDLNWSTSAVPKYVHPEDREFFKSNPELVANVASVPTACDKMACGFHPRLLPVPYMGNLLGDSQRADVFLLMTNPVVRYEDYVDSDNARFAQAWHENIAGKRETCLAWDSEGVGPTSWTRYYRDEVLGPTIQGHPGMCESLRTRLAILELVPYYSPNAECIKGELLDALPSVRAARRAAKYLEERSHEGKAHLIVRWQNGCERWRICEDGENVVHSPARRGLSQCAKRRLLEWLYAGRR
jgi:hypothetical protein